MDIFKLHPPLSKILLMEKLISEEALLKALRYQLHQNTGNLSLPQILIAFNYLHPRTYLKLREEYPERDEDPIGQLLLEEGVVSKPQLLKALTRQSEAPRYQYLGEVMIDLGMISHSHLTEFLDHYSPLAHTVEQDCISPDRLLARRKDATAYIRQLMINKCYLNEQQLDYLMPQSNYLPLKLKPLGDVMVMNGDLLETELQQALAEKSNLESQPLSALLVDVGILQEWQIAHILCMQSMSEHPDRNLALTLTQTGYVTTLKLEMTVAEYFRNQVPTGELASAA